MVKKSFHQSIVSSYRKKRKSCRINKLPIKAITIYVKTVAGKIISLTVKGSETINTIKQKIEDVTGLRSYKQSLLFCGQYQNHILMDGYTLNNYKDIKNESIIYMVPTPAQKFKAIEVRNKLYEFNLDELSTVHQFVTWFMERYDFYLHFANITNDKDIEERIIKLCTIENDCHAWKLLYADYKKVQHCLLLVLYFFHNQTTFIR